MKHLKCTQESYLEHLRFAWLVAFTLFVHGIFPNIWEFRATELMQRKELERREKLRRFRDEL